MIPEPAQILRHDSTELELLSHEQDHAPLHDSFHHLGCRRIPVRSYCPCPRLPYFLRCIDSHKYPPSCFKHTVFDIDSRIVYHQHTPAYHITQGQSECKMTSRLLHLIQVTSNMTRGPTLWRLQPHLNMSKKMLQTHAYSPAPHLTPPPHGNTITAASQAHHESPCLHHGH